MTEQMRNFRAVFCSEEQRPDIVDEVLKFRKELFVDTLGWDLEVREGRERDQFDNAAAVHCALFCSDQLVGGFRAIRTDGPYLANTVFPDLASVRPFPHRRDIWEISRFGIRPTAARLEIAKLNYSLMFRFAHLRQATALVAIADLTYERFLAALGIRTRRYGRPQTIGADMHGRPLQVVAGEIPLAEQSSKKFQTILELARHVEIEDAALVLGPSRVSA